MDVSVAISGQALPVRTRSAREKAACRMSFQVIRPDGEASRQCNLVLRCSLFGSVL
jgi:hypothetical protein